jgi:hypothetical protein
MQIFGKMIGRLPGVVSRPCSHVTRFLLIIALVIPLLFAAPKRAEAICVCCCLPLIPGIWSNIIIEIGLQSVLTNTWIILEFLLNELWLAYIYYQFYWGSAMAMMTEQMTAISMYQMQIIGAFLDAKHQIETQRLFSELNTQAMKDYYPSDQLCTIGSAARSLGQADRNAQMTGRLMAQWSLDRQLLNGNSNASEGQRQDRKDRTAQFLATYCDRNDNNRGLSAICTSPTQGRRNKDVDFGYTLGQPWTLDINFSDQTITDDEADVLALASNLYSHDIFRQVSEKLMFQDTSHFEQNQSLYLDARAIVAKRSVAQQTVQAIAGMKSRGASDAAQTATYLRAIMRQLGIASDAEVDAIIGQNPSYYAQMEILTKKLFQDPGFFVDLYDKPANAARKSAALEALGLIQENDTFNSALRTEQMLSVLLELRLMTEQKTVENKVSRVAK